MSTVAPTTTGYADVNGVHLYVETYGAGTPLLLLHGGMLTIDLDFADLIPTLAGRHLVIAVEQQGHGRTADIDRPITPANLAADVVGLLDHLGVDRAHVLGHSMGAAVALELAVSHPDRVRSVVPITSSSFTTLPRSKRIWWTLPSRLISRASHSLSAFTTDTPTPCRPPEIL